MGPEINIDLGSAYREILQQIAEWFGTDPDSIRWKASAQEWIRNSQEQTASIQCVGMSDPVDIEQVYQQQKLKCGEDITSIETLVEARQDAIVFAGPGFGKTTLLRWSYRRLVGRKNIIPILVTLRLPNAAVELSGLVTQMDQVRGDRSALKAKLLKEKKYADAKRISDPKSQIVLLVDGYDEISEDERALVSATLRRFRQSVLGSFIMTCRLGYEVLDLNAKFCSLMPFEADDSCRFIEGLAKTYKSLPSSQNLYREIVDAGLSSFAGHPLLLTLLCIVRVSSNKFPTRVIDLIKAAIDQLSLEWDHSKGVKRISITPISAIHRLNLLKFVAYKLDLRASEFVVERFVSQRLRRLGFSSVDPRTALLEIHQWYGIIVPVGLSEWQFVHRSVQDYLAACHSVETGQFAQMVEPLKTSRAAFAMSLLEDATAHVCRLLLIDDRVVEVFRAFLENGGAFDMHVVAEALIARVERMKGYHYHSVLGCVACSLDEDFMKAATDEFLRILVVKGGRHQSEWGEVIAVYALAELIQNRVSPSAPVSLTVHSFSGRLDKYLRSPSFTVEVVRELLPRPFVFSTDQIVKLFQIWET